MNETVKFILSRAYLKFYENLKKTFLNVYDGLDLLLNDSFDDITIGMFLNEKTILDYFNFSGFFFKNPDESSLNEIIDAYYSESKNLILVKDKYFHSYNLQKYIDDEHTFDELIDIDISEYCEDCIEEDILKFKNVTGKIKELKPNIIFLNGLFDNSAARNKKTICSISLFEFIEKYANLAPRDINKIKNSIIDYSKKANALNDKKLSYFIEEDNTFKNDFIKEIFRTISDKYGEEEEKLVRVFLERTNYSEELMRLLFTYRFAESKFLRDSSKYDYLDLSFVVVSIFKLVEILFCEFVNKLWKNKVIKRLHYPSGDLIPLNKQRKVYLSDDDLTLGELFSVFDCGDKDICAFIDSREPYSSKLKILLIEFINTYRNGFLHKHSIESKEKLRVSVDKTLEVIFLLVLFFETPSVNKLKTIL